MKKALIFSCMAALSLAFGMQNASAQEVNMAPKVQETVSMPFEEFRLENGLRVFLLRVPGQHPLLSAVQSKNTNWCHFA